MNHTWRPCPVRLAQGIEVCARPGCTAERRPNTRKGGHYTHRAHAGAQWDHIITPRCTGKSLAKPRRTIDRGDEF